MRKKVTRKILNFFYISNITPITPYNFIYNYFVLFISADIKTYQPPRFYESTRKKMERKKVLRNLFTLVTASRVSEVHPWRGAVAPDARSENLCWLAWPGWEPVGSPCHLVCIFVSRHYSSDLLNPTRSYGGRSPRIRNRRRRAPPPHVSSASRGPIIRNRRGNWLLGGRGANP